LISNGSDGHKHASWLRLDGVIFFDTFLVLTLALGTKSLVALLISVVGSLGWLTEPSDRFGLVLSLAFLGSFLHALLIFVVSTSAEDGSVLFLGFFILLLGKVLLLLIDGLSIHLFAISSPSLCLLLASFSALFPGVREC
jgi:hypothetical protein